MNHPGKYLYCIIPCSEERTFDNLVPLGGTPGEVHAIAQDGLAAVVSNTLQTRYESTRENMIAHEKVIEKVMQEFTVLPVRFGTVTVSTTPVADIRKLLNGRRQEFCPLLKDLDGKVELSLKVFWRDEKAIFQEIVAENQDIQRLRDSLLRQPPRATDRERIALGEMVKSALERKRNMEAATLLKPLRPLASQVKDNKVILDRMVMNAAFLVGKSSELQFDGVVRELEASNSGRMVFKYIGPAPPYNFVNIVVNWQELKG